MISYSKCLFDLIKEGDKCNDDFFYINNINQQYYILDNRYPILTTRKLNIDEILVGFKLFIKDNKDKIAKILNSKNNETISDNFVMLDKDIQISFFIKKLNNFDILKQIVYKEPTIGSIFNSDLSTLSDALDESEIIGYLHSIFLRSILEKKLVDVITNNTGQVDEYNMKLTDKGYDAVFNYSGLTHKLIMISDSKESDYLKEIPIEISIMGLLMEFISTNLNVLPECINYRTQKGYMDRKNITLSRKQFRRQDYKSTKIVINKDFNIDNSDVGKININYKSHPPIDYF